MHLRAHIFILAATWIITACGGGKSDDGKPGAATAPETDGAEAALDTGTAFAEKKETVLLFIAPECPLCQNYAPALPALADTLADMNLPLTAVVSGTYYTMREAETFLSDHRLNIPLIRDTAFILARRYGAVITPEAVLTDSTGSAVYRGAIDNWAISLGRKRLRPTDFYLTDAARNYRAGKKIDPETTDAVGCFIE